MAPLPRAANDRNGSRLRFESLAPLTPAHSRSPSDYTLSFRPKVAKATGVEEPAVALSRPCTQRKSCNPTNGACSVALKVSTTSGFHSTCGYPKFLGQFARDLLLARPSSHFRDSSGPPRRRPSDVDRRYCWSCSTYAGRSIFIFALLIVALCDPRIEQPRKLRAASQLVLTEANLLCGTPLLALHSC